MTGMSPMMRFALNAMAELIAEADLSFVLMLFDKDGKAMIVGDIPPGKAIAMIEKALKRAKDNVAAPIDGEETLQ